MKKVLALVGLLLISCISTGALLSPQPPVCTATPPGQAIAAGYTKLVVCNTLMSIPGVVDVNNTNNPWFLFYMQAFGQTLPSINVTTSGSGLVLSGGANGSGGPYSLIVTPTSYAGNTITGGFYIEITAQFNSAVCEQSPSLWPAPIWLDYPNAMTNHNADGVRFTEFDIFEWINCVSTFAVHDWTNGGTQTLNCTNSNEHVPISPGTGPNIYGGLFVPANGGTGSFKWYFNNTLENTVTYSASAVPNPAGSCPSGAFSSADAQPWAFNMQGGTTNATTVRSLHIWQAP